MGWQNYSYTDYTGIKDAAGIATDKEVTDRLSALMLKLLVILNTRPQFVEQGRCVRPQKIKHGRVKHCELWSPSFNYVIGPALLLGLRAAARVTGYRRLCIGKLSVLGDARFLSLCNSSVERLKRLDPILHRLLTNRPVWLFHSAKAEPYVGNLGPPWLFSIHPRAVEWGSDGMMARLVYIAFCISRFPSGYARPEEAEATHKAVMALSHSWLESRGFPQELAESCGFF